MGDNKIKNLETLKCLKKPYSEKDVEEDSFWAEGSFIESISIEEMKLKERTINMKNTEEMNYNCKKCNVKISAHNNDWHAHMCDRYFWRSMGSGKKI
ncbi:MAG: hypothetical protein AABX39_06170 [Nanoarchaeota archaeon]